MIKPNYNNEYTGSNSGELIQDLIEENVFLLKLVDTIPPKMYFDHDIQEKITSEKHLTMDKKAESLKRGFSGNTEMSAKNKHKRAKLDPLCQKSVSQIHQELGNNKQKKSHKKKGLLLSSASLTRAANIEELQKRLQERIDEMQLKRKGSGNNGPSKRRLKKEKKKQKAASIKVNETNMQANKALPKVKPDKVEPAPKYNTEGKIIYSKLDFTEDGMPQEKQKNEFGGKNYKELLKKAEKKKEKLLKLKSVDPEKAVTVEEKQKWKKALLLSENVKLKDNPELLKKSIKKQEKIKKKKAKDWKERIENVESKKNARQEKRTKNLQKRKDDKLKNKIKHAKKRGRVITS